MDDFLEILQCWGKEKRLQFDKAEKKKSGKEKKWKRKKNGKEKKRKRKKWEKKRKRRNISVSGLEKLKTGHLGPSSQKQKKKVFSMENFQKYIEKHCSSGWTQV